eukprot:777495-Rhodomonas_salina.1
MPRYLRWRAGSTCWGQSAFERRVPGSSRVLTVAQPHIPYRHPLSVHLLPQRHRRRLAVEDHLAAQVLLHVILVRALEPLQEILLEPLHDLEVAARYQQVVNVR